MGIFRKPWHRPRNIALSVAVSFVVLVGWFAYEAWQYTSQKANPSVDYHARYRDLLVTRTGIDPERGERAWAKLMDAVAAVDEVVMTYNRELKAAGVDRRDEYDTGEAQFHRLNLGRELPSNCEREIEALRRIDATPVHTLLAEFVEMAPGLRPPEGTAGLAMNNVVLPELGKIREVAKALTAHMRTQALAGDSAYTARAFRQCLAIGQTVSLQPGVVNALTGASIYAMATEELRQLVREDLLDGETCRHAMQSLDEYPLADSQLAIEGEHFFFQNSVQHLFTDDGSGDGHMLASEGDMLSSFGSSRHSQSIIDKVLGRISHASRKDTEQAYQKFVDAALVETSKPSGQRWVVFDPDDYADDLGTQYSLVNLMVPAICKSLDNLDVARMKGSATKIMLALKLYREQYGQFPSALDELVPQFIRSVPTDELSGASFGYRLLDSDGDTPQYMLYSLGLDGADNQGLIQQDGDRQYECLYKRTTAGFDFVINQARMPLND